MDCPVCDKQFSGPTCYCGFAKPGGVSKVAHRSTEHARPEQGVDMASALGQPLRDALVAIGNITTLRVQLSRAATGGLPKRIADECKQKEATAISALRASLVKLPPPQVTELVQKYPWVAAC